MSDAILPHQGFHGRVDSLFLATFGRSPLSNQVVNSTWSVSLFLSILLTMHTSLRLFILIKFFCCLAQNITILYKSVYRLNWLAAIITVMIESRLVGSRRSSVVVGVWF